MKKLLKEHHLVFHPLFEAHPHVFISSVNPLAKQDYVTLEDLAAYPYLSFDQGVYNSFYYSEEILSTIDHPKSIRVSDRATLFNLLIGLNGYTISTGILSTALNGTNIVALPLKVNELIQVGWIGNAKTQLSRLGELYISKLTTILAEDQLS